MARYQAAIYKLLLCIMPISIVGYVTRAVVTLIVSMTKFSIVICSPGAYLRRNRRAICTSITRDLMTFLCFQQFLKLMENTSDFFAQKKSLKDFF